MPTITPQIRRLAPSPGPSDNNRLMLVRVQVSADMGQLVEVATRVRDEDGYPVYLATGDFLACVDA